MFLINQPNRMFCHFLSYFLLAAAINSAFDAKVEAQSPWRAVKRAANRYDKAVRDAQRIQNQYAKQVQRQQEKIIRQNEQAIRKFNRSGKPAALVFPYEPAPVVFHPSQVIAAPSIVTPVEVAPVDPPMTWEPLPSSTISYGPVFSSVDTNTIIESPIVGSQEFVPHPTSPKVQNVYAPGGPIRSVSPSASQPQHVFGASGVPTPATPMNATGTPTPAEPIDNSARAADNLPEPIRNEEDQPALEPIPVGITTTSSAAQQ